MAHADHSRVAASLLTLMLREAGKGEGLEPPRPGVAFAFIKHDTDTYTGFSGGALPTFEGVRDVFAKWFGAPKITENKIGNELIGQRAEFPNGVSMVFLMERGGGITLTIPKRQMVAVAQQLAQQQASASWQR